MSIGFRVFPNPPQVDPELVERFAQLPVATVSDAGARLRAGGASLRPMHNGAKMAGTAVTVLTRPGDNLMVHQAIDMARPGDVVVVDAGGVLANALIGELMSAHAESRGLAGLVIYGAVRDAVALRQSAFPVYAAGVTHRGPYKDGPGEVNVPIAINGMVIQPGDIVLGDDDGIISVTARDAEEIYAIAKAKHDKETQQLIDIAGGRNARQWVSQTLTRLGCEFVEG